MPKDEVQLITAAIPQGGSESDMESLLKCDKCPLKDKCRSQKCGKQNREFKYNESDLRSMHRRQIEATDKFKFCDSDYA